MPFPPSGPPRAELDLYFAFIEETASPPHLEACRSWLSDEEKARADRFHFERDKKLYTVAHALVRQTLESYLGEDGRALRFVAQEHGRPELEGAASRALSFNLSHTHGLVLFGVAPPGTGLGVDAEVENPQRSGLDIAQRFFSAREFAALQELPEAERMNRFFSLWTLKESYVKADGAGLTLPLDRFSFSFDAVPHLSVAFEAAINDTPSRWRFGLCRASPEHQAAFGLRWAGPAPLEVNCFRVRALDRIEPFAPEWLARTETPTSPGV